MSANAWAVLLVTIAAIPATLFPICYGITAQWWRSFVGWGLMVSSVALAALLDLSLMGYRWPGFVPTWLALTVLALIAVGAWLMFLGWLVTRLRPPRRS
ncbi:hypothetical protein [Nocardioides sp. YIM 152315]|uniref:putative phage holin n=1 Tax=Nocardioides sp. YIM 152315 TaxID=3031760 RepID=UPI0023DC0E64|nr:hypothetical protein [Nocardioides sp. YIM 152315]MDF1603409.1 hypothetical protein [Nocardioides sp. YIM 152315]